MTYRFEYVDADPATLEDTVDFIDAEWLDMVDEGWTMTHLTVSKNKLDDIKNEDWEEDYSYHVAITFRKEL